MYMELVKCSEEYWEFVRELRIDERVISGFIATTFITKQQQRSYMNTYHTCYRVALVDGNPAGYVGVIEDDIRVCTHPDYQGKGVGKFMIEEAMKIWPTAEGKVKIGNEASMNLFKSCGFTEAYIIFKK